MLCGDEVQAAVIDIGTSFSKFGTSGQDLPRHVFRSDLCTANDSTSSNKRLVVGDSALKCQSSSSEIRRPFSNGTHFLFYLLISLRDIYFCIISRCSRLGCD